MGGCEIQGNLTGTDAGGVPRRGQTLPAQPVPRAPGIRRRSARTALSRPLLRRHTGHTVRMVDGSATQWLVLVYRIPSEPTRLRAAVWRRLKALGAVYLQNSVAALPEGGAAERALRTLRNEIHEMGGTAQLLKAAPLAGHGDLVGAFNAARDDEYEEIVDRCRDFLTEIERETAAEHFTYGELEENDEDLVKLRRWFDKVAARDVLAASGRRETEEALARAEASLADFAERVYSADPDT